MAESSALLLTSSITLGCKGEDMLEECMFLFAGGGGYHSDEETEDKDTEETRLMIMR